MKILYVQTDVDEDLLGTFLLFPFWWISGLNIYIFQCVAGFVFIKLLMRSIQTGTVLSIATPCFWFAVFLVIYFVSLVVNASYYPLQRVLASLNNYAIFMMGFLMVLTLCNCADERYLKRFMAVCHWLCLVTGILAILFLGLWCFSIKLDTFSLLERIFPKMKEYPFFFLQWSIRSAVSDWTMDDIPRLGIYSRVYIATGGFMAMLIPLMTAFHQLRKSGPVTFGVCLLLSLIPLVFSLSRMAVLALLAAFIFVEAVDRKVKPHWILAGLGMITLAANYLLKLLGILFYVRSNSTYGRLNLYSEAFKIVMEQNPLIGIGIRPRNDFSTMIVGSHSHYVELMLVTGFLGLAAFLLFQIGVFRTWFVQRSFLQTREQRILWKYLGMSYVAANAILLTSGLDALSFMGYTHFLIAGAILGFSRVLTLSSSQKIGSEVL